MRKPVEEIMTKKLVTVQLSDSVRTAYQVMHERRIRHLPVEDDTGAIIGILSDRDLQRAMTPKQGVTYENDSEIEFDPNLKAKDFMSWPIQTVSSEASVFSVAKMMLREKISAILVQTTNQRVRGIVTTDDMLKLLLQFLEKDPSNLEMKMESLFEDIAHGAYLI